MKITTLPHVDLTKSSQLLDAGDTVVHPPEHADLRIVHRDEYLKRLNDLQSPKERLLQLGLSIIDPHSLPTHEAFWIRNVAAYSVMLGWVFGSFTRSQHLHEDYVRQHNYSVFEGTHVKNRHRIDNFVFGLIRKGAKFGIGCGLLCTSASIIGLGSITYRNDLHLLDWLIGFGALGSLTRCWLGVRGVVAGGVLGVGAGFVGYGVVRMLEKLSGRTVVQMRYYHHVEYMQTQEETLEKLRRMREKWGKDKML